MIPIEAGYPARSAADHDELLRELMTLPMLPIDAEIEPPRSTRSVNSRAPGTVAFRPLISHLCAGGSGVGVSHYDRGYDTLAARTDPHFASVWLARRVSL